MLDFKTRTQQKTGTETRKGQQTQAKHTAEGGRIPPQKQKW